MFLFSNDEEIMTIIHLENDRRKINRLQETEILEVAYSRNLLNDFIGFKSDPEYELQQNSKLNDERNILATD